MSFADELARQAGETKGRNVTLTMEMNFCFSDVRMNYVNLDLLVEAADRHFREDDGAIGVFDGRFDGVNIFYSTPERYTRCVVKMALFIRVWFLGLPPSINVLKL